MSEMMMMPTTMTNSPQESTESDSSRRDSSSSSEDIMSEMMLMTTTMTNSPQESAESDSSRRDSTSSSSDLSDGSHGSSGSPPLKRPRLATVIEPLFDDEYEDLLFSLLDFTVKPKVKYDGPSQGETFAKLVLTHYKDTTGKDYELSRIRSMMPFPPRRQGICPDGSRQESSDGGTHLNFFACPTGFGPEYLFYGELSHRPRTDEVVDCYMFPLGTDDGVDLILHPPYVLCPDCDDLGRYEDYDDLEEQ